MQTRSTINHHHQRGSPKDSSIGNSMPGVSLTPEAELIALARSKGQVLTESTLRLIRETLELRNVTLVEFVADVRPHFRNEIRNPSGFMISRARRFHELSRPAVARVSSAPAEGPTRHCESCKGQKFVIGDKKIELCPACSTPESRREWEAKEAERERRVRAIRDRNLRQIAGS
jgi:hypothetical protein